MSTMSAVHAPAPHSPPLEYSSPPSSPPTSSILSFLPDLPTLSNLPKLGRTRDTRCKSPPPTPSSSSRYAPLSHPLSSTVSPSTTERERERDVECGDCLPLPLSTGRSKLSRSGVGRYVRTLQISLRSPARNPIFLRDELDMITILLVMFNIFVWTRYFFA